MKDLIFNKEEEEKIFTLVDRLIGTTKLASDKPAIFINNIKRRIFYTNLNSLHEYLAFVQKNPQEFDQMVSALTIHTTYWFRERRHFIQLEKIISESKELQNSKIKILSLACSIGLEVYSLALVLENLRIKYPNFDYKIAGVDVDSLCIIKAQSAIYDASDIKKIPEEYHNNIKIGAGKSEGLLTFTSEIISRCSFQVGNALKINYEDEFDFSFCRNMLIYFSQNQVNSIVKNLIRGCKSEGYVILGVNEFISEKDFEVDYLKDSIYRVKNKISKERREERKLHKIDPAKTQVLPEEKSKESYDVLIVDDSETVRFKIAELLNAADLSNIGVATCDAADQILKNCKIKLIVLDLNLEEMNGDVWIQRKRSNGLTTPCCIITGAEKDDVDRILASILNDISDFFFKDNLFKDHKEFVKRIKILVSAGELERPQYLLPVVVVEDDRDIRQLICGLLKAQGYVVVDFSSAEEALIYCSKEPFIGFILDHKLENMRGLTFAEKILQDFPHSPIVMATGSEEILLKTSDLPSQVKVVAKPFSADKLVAALNDGIICRYEGIFSSPIDFLSNPFDLLVIGGSTGGPIAFNKILEKVGSANFPPVLIVQHIPENYQIRFAEKLAKNANLDFVAVSEKVKLKRGTLYCAAPQFHIEVSGKKDSLFAEGSDAQAYMGHKPSVNHLFHSAATLKNTRVLAILLTGMGDDGAAGMQAIASAGGFTIAQNLSSCTVFGMPKAAIDKNSAKVITNLNGIHAILQKL